MASTENLDNMIAKFNWLVENHKGDYTEMVYLNEFELKTVLCALKVFKIDVEENEKRS